LQSVSGGGEVSSHIEGQRGYKRRDVFLRQRSWLFSPNPPIPAPRSKWTTFKRLGLQLHLLRASTEAGIDSAFVLSTQFGVVGLVIGPDNFFNTRNQQLAKLALRYPVPAIFNDRAFAAVCWPIGPAPPSSIEWRAFRSAVSSKAERPVDLPVQESTKVELTINLKTARSLDLSVPPMLLARADEVIEYGRECRQLALNCPSAISKYRSPSGVKEDPWQAPRVEPGCEYQLEPPVIWRRNLLPTITVQADVVPGIEAKTVNKQLAPAIAQLAENCRRATRSKPAARSRRAPRG
jgi:hypothetical protein